MAEKWSQKVNVHTGADAGAPTIGLLSGTADFLRMNTDLAWTNRPLAIFANNDVIQAVVSPFGGLFKVNSQASLDLWGPYENSDVIVALSRADVAGEPDSQLIQLAATSDSWTFAGEVFIDSNAASTGAAGNYNAQVNVAANNATITTEVLNRVSTAEGAWIDVVGFAAQTNAFNFRISDAGGPITQFSPMVADGATAVAYLFDTSNTLANATARLASWRNNGGERIAFAFDGGIVVGPNTETFQAELSAGFTCMRDSVSERNATLVVGTFDSGSSEFANLEFAGDQNGCVFKVVTSNFGVGGSLQCDCATTGTKVDFQLLIDGGPVTRFRPGIADGATAEAYIFDTSTALANAGARIASFEIQTSRKASIDVNGAYFVGANQVVGARVVDARIDDAINSGDATTDGVIDACRDALIAHGLCTAA